MIIGFNHNIRYRGILFHVQTEDSGLKNPQLITLLYHGGTIIASQKTVYADIIKVDNLAQVVEDLAKEQHKGMLRRLTRGEFDRKIIDLGIPLGPIPLHPEVPEGATDAAVHHISGAEQLPEAKPVTGTASEPEGGQPDSSLDELIYAYLSCREV